MPTDRSLGLGSVEVETVCGVGGRSVQVDVVRVLGFGRGLVGRLVCGRGGGSGGMGGKSRGRNGGPGSLRPQVGLGNGGSKGVGRSALLVGIQRGG